MKLLDLARRSALAALGAALLALPASAAFQLSDATRNAMADQWETTIGTAPTLEIYEGTLPTNCAAAAIGTVVATMVLPSDWMGAAAAGGTVGRKEKLGTWQDTAADSSGPSVDYFRIRQGATCHLQGTVTATGGGGDMTLQNTNIATGQAVTVDTFVFNMGGG